MKRNIIFLSICTLLAVGSLEVKAQDDKKKETPKKEEKAKADSTKTKADSTKPKETSYEKLLKDPQKVSRGLMNLYYVKNKLYMEIPLQLMDRQMLLASTISAISDNMDGVVGSKPQPPLQVIFSLVDSTVLLRELNQNIIAPQDDENLLSAIGKNSIGAILKIFPVQAYDSSRTAAVIDVTDYFAGDTRELSPFGAFSIYNSMGVQGSQSFKRDRSFIDDVKSFEDNIMIKSFLSYENTMMQGKTTVAKDKPFSVVMTRTFLLLSDHPARPRKLDPRVGIFYTGKYSLSNDVDKTEEIYFANRFRLEPKDIKAYSRGKLTEPVKPIVFYVDSDFPESWKQTVKDAIEDWQKVFEKIGYKNAVIAKDFPKDDPGFDPDNLKYNCVRYAPVPVANATGPSWVDPRTGEIINASVYVYHDIVKLLNNWMFIQTSPADKNVRQTTLPETYMQQGLRYVIRHEIGHCLGFMHNMGASSSIPVDSLRSPAFTKKYGTTYSIMDYARFNYIAQPGDMERGVRLSPPEFGVYDYFAVQWNYQYFDPAKVSREEEEKTLAKMVADKAGDPRYRFGPQQGNPLDPSSQTEDLGDDAVQASMYGIKNLQYIMKHLNSWVAAQDRDYSYRQEIWKGIVQQYVRYINHVYAYVGGLYFNEKYAGDPRPFYQSVPRKKQEAALRFMLTEIENLDWLEDRDVLENMTLTGTPAALLLQQMTTALLQAPRKVVLSAYKSKEANPLNAEEVMTMIHSAAWKTTLQQQLPGKATREIQKAYVTAIIGNSRLIGNSSGSATAITGNDQLPIQIPGFTIQQDHDICGMAIQDRLPGILGETSATPWTHFLNFNVTPAFESLYFKYLNATRDLLKSAVADTTDEETLVHYQLLLHQIEKALK